MRYERDKVREYENIGECAKIGGRDNIRVPDNGSESDKRR